MRRRIYHLFILFVLFGILSLRNSEWFVLGPPHMGEIVDWSVLYKDAPSVFVFRYTPLELAHLDPHWTNRRSRQQMRKAKLTRTRRERQRCCNVKQTLTSISVTCSFRPPKTHCSAHSTDLQPLLTPTHDYTKQARKIIDAHRGGIRRKLTNLTALILEEHGPSGHQWPTPYGLSELEVNAFIKGT